MNVVLPVALLFLAFFVAMIVVGLVWAVIAALNRAAKTRREALQEVARRSHGRVEESFWGGTAVCFEVDGAPAKLTYFAGSDNAPPHTKLHVDWAPPGSMRVAPENTWASVKKFFGGQDLHVGDPDFDAAFLIQGHPEAWVRGALSPATRERLVELSALGAERGFFGKRKGMTLDANPGGVIFKCPRDHTKHPEDLVAFYEASVAVFRALRGSTDGGVSISVSEVVQAGKCPVCSDASGELAKRCQGCNAAYHRECWDYLGGCAIFGCEDRYRAREPRAQSW